MDRQTGYTGKLLLQVAQDSVLKGKRFAILFANPGLTRLEGARLANLIEALFPTVQFKTVVTSLKYDIYFDAGSDRVSIRLYSHMNGDGPLKHLEGQQFDGVLVDNSMYEKPLSKVDDTLRVISKLNLNN